MDTNDESAHGYPGSISAHAVRDAHVAGVGGHARFATIVASDWPANAALCRCCVGHGDPHTEKVGDRTNLGRQCVVGAIREGILFRPYAVAYAATQTLNVDETVERSILYVAHLYAQRDDIRLHRVEPTSQLSTPIDTLLITAQHGLHLTRRQPRTELEGRPQTIGEPCDLRTLPWSRNVLMLKAVGGEHELPELFPHVAGDPNGDF